MKKIISIIISVLLFIFFSTASAHADRKTVEGFMLGTGVAILGAAIYNEIQKDSTPEFNKNRSRHNEYRYSGYERGHNRNYRSHQPRGHWEITKIWMKPVYENKWNPGHYNPRGEWVYAGNQNFLVQDGYWRTEKIWVRH